MSKPAFAGWFTELKSGMSYRLWEQGGHEPRPGDVALFTEIQARPARELTDAESACKDVFNDYDVGEISTFSPAIREAWKVGAMLAAQKGPK